jgi:hypothetical protein
VYIWRIADRVDRAFSYISHRMIVLVGYTPLCYDMQHGKHPFFAVSLCQIVAVCNRRCGVRNLYFIDLGRELKATLLHSNRKELDQRLLQVPLNALFIYRHSRAPTVH